MPQPPAPLDLSSIALLERLVAFNTVSDRSNLPLISFVSDYLTSHGIPFVIAPNAAGDKAALYATIGPMIDGGIVLSGHTDVVPVVGQAWTTDPFTLRKEGTRYFGRGACDMKGFDAVCLAMAPELMKLPLKAPIHILLSYDEETTCLGVMDVIARMGTDLPRPSAVFVGEPTSMQVADAHKSVASIFTTIHGFEVHSSSPQTGVNAISGGAMVVAELERIFEEMIARGDPTGRFDLPIPRCMSARSPAARRATSRPRNAASTGNFAACPALMRTRFHDALMLSSTRRFCRASRALAARHR